MKISMKPAYMWDCEECGRENFERGLVPELSEDEEQELREEYGVDDEEMGHWVMMPRLVQCKYCKKTCETVHYSEEE